MRRTLPTGVSRWVVVATILLATSCSSAAVPTGEATGDELRRAAVALAADEGLADDDIPSSPTFTDGGTALATACFLTVDALGDAQERPAQLVTSQLAVARAMAVGDDIAAEVREHLAAISTAIELGDTPALGRAGGALLDACASAIAGG